ncbi:MAG: hypothetical protein AAF108_07670 [Planctomycetota bacterium]
MSLTDAAPYQKACDQIQSDTHAMLDQHRKDYEANVISEVDRITKETHDLLAEANRWLKDQIEAYYRDIVPAVRQIQTDTHETLDRYAKERADVTRGRVNEIRKETQEFLNIWSPRPRG